MKSDVAYIFLALIVAAALLYFAPKITEKIDATFGTISRVLRPKE